MRRYNTAIREHTRDILFCFLHPTAIACVLLARDKIWLRFYLPRVEPLLSAVEFVVICATQRNTTPQAATKFDIQTAKTNFFKHFIFNIFFAKSSCFKKMKTLIFFWAPNDVCLFCAYPLPSIRLCPVAHFIVVQVRNLFAFRRSILSLVSR